MLKQKDLKSYKEKLSINQNKLCALTGLSLPTEISKAHLDHDHELDGPKAGRCRGLLLPNANVLEGRIKHQFKRSGLQDKIGYIDFLKRLVHYLEQDYTSNPVHPQLVPDLKRRFGRYNSNQMQEVLRGCSLCTEGTKKQLTDRYSKYLRSYYGSSKKISTER